MKKAILTLLRFLGKVVLQITQWIFGLLSFCVIVFVLIFYFSNPDKYKSLIVAQLERVTEQQIELAGPIKISFDPLPRIHLNKIKLSTKNNKKLVFFAKYFSFDVDPLFLLGKQKQLKNIMLTDLVISAYQDNNKKLTEMIVIDKFKGTLKQSGCQIKSDKFMIKIGETEFSGKFILKNMNKTPTLDLSLSTKKLTAAGGIAAWPIFIALNSVVNVQTQAFILGDRTLKNANINFQSENKKIKGKVKALLDASPLELAFDIPDQDFKQDFIFKADLKAEKLAFQGYSFEQAVLNIIQEQKQTKLNVSGQWAKSAFMAQFQWDPSSPKKQREISVEAKINVSNAAEFIKKFDPNFRAEGGVMTIDFTGSTVGSFPELSSEVLLSHLSGQSLIKLNDLTLLRAALDARLENLWVALFRGLKLSGNTPILLKCMVVKMQGKQGVFTADNTIAFETPEIYGLGRGGIDFNTQRINLAFNIHPRSQLNIEIGSMDNVIYVQGGFKNPVVRLGSQGIVREGGSLLLGIMTGGTSLLAEKFFKIIKHKHAPCQEVLSKP